MAMATAKCHCVECGKDFTFRKEKRNRKDADEFEIWAAANITLCPDCSWKEKQQQEKAALEEYISDFSQQHPLPEIQGVSEKQIAYADSLRNKFIAKKMLACKVDVNRFFDVAAHACLETLKPGDVEKLQQAAEEAGQTFDDYFADFRADFIRKFTGLMQTADAKNVELIFRESNASKLIDALR